jgi:GDP-L-fucose synthase
VDLLNQEQVRAFFEEHKPDFVFLAAGKVGGVYANNTYRAEFIYENLVIQTNLIHQSYLSEVKKLIFFGCSSMYPQITSQPMKEEFLFSGHLEPTNEPFAVSKLAGVKLCESYNRQYGTDFISVIPTNIYGINQCYDPMNSLVVPALIRKFHEARHTNAKKVVIWGSGRPSRDFLFSDDLADAVIILMETYSDNDILNIGTGRDYTIVELIEIVKEVVNYEGEVIYDVSKPDGVLVKLQDITKMRKLGWQHEVGLKEGIRRVYDEFKTMS